MSKLVKCICGHEHIHKSRCKECPCRYGTDNRKASNRIISSKVNRWQKPGMKILRQYFTPDVIAQALQEERRNPSA